MKRIFYFSGYNITVFHWLAKDFAGSYTFMPTDQGLAEFAKYLETIDSGAVKFLVDIIEEDFIKEQIPHVGKQDQRAIASRFINRLYRKSKDYYTYKIIGRESKGRKDDIVLYSVITNPDIFAKWLDVIRSKKTPISGIWSLPLISDSVLKKITSSAGNILLVSQQVPSNLRQSFFINGKFEISRNAVINPDDMSLGEYINEEVEQTSRFLANQRYIGFDDIVNIHVICAKADIENIRAYCEDTPLKIYHYHAVEGVKESFGCGSIPGNLSSGVFAFQCNLKNAFGGHYGPNYLFRDFYQQILKNSIYAINSMVALAALIFVANEYVSAQVLKAETITLNQHQENINRKYIRDFKANETELAHAVAMQSSVKFYERVDSIKQVSPQKFMNKLSEYLQTSSVQNITITEVSWSSEQGNIGPAKNRNSRTSIELSSNLKIKHYGKIKGLIGSKGDNFEHAVKKVSAVLAVLNNHDAIERLDIIKMPFDVRSESDLNNSHSYDDMTKNDKHREFEFHVLMKGGGNV